MEANIKNQFDNLLSTKSDNKDEILKATVLTHLLQGDYERIAQIRADYPVNEMMNLLGRFDTIVHIDLDKLFGLAA